MSDARFEERSASIPEGSTLLMCTDGITEARNPRGQFFGPERVQQTVLRADKRAPFRPSPRPTALYPGAPVHLQPAPDDLSVLVARF